MVEKKINAIVSPQVHGYVSAILPDFLANKSYVPSKTYVPLRQLTPNQPEIMHKTTDEIIDLADTSYGGEGAFFYLFTELINNIEDHSNSTKAFIMAQKYKKLDFTEACVFDNGITIPKCFENHDINFSTDSEAIEKAMNGKSTKKDQNGRGWGINTNVQIFTEGLDGEIFIASRDGAVYINKDKIERYRSSGIYHLDGTLVSLRIPRGSIDVTKYLERKDILRDKNAREV
ncbi:MAG: hypothetical protein QMD61_03920 [Methanobacterium sp.]|nr:hypothetical protein [Methanobacterium sp.]